ncbi:hypothetical protein A2Y99_02345, partial [Candidatus Gottesmanbacteria bacterium RBG_13_37_7]
SLPLSLYIDPEKPAVFFSPTHYSPRFAFCPRIIAIMDLSYIRFPEMFTKKDLYQLQHWTSYSVKKADKIITISNFSKSEIIDYYQISAERILVTYPGYDKDKYKKLEIINKINLLKIKKKYQIEGEYILFVGTLQPRKNLIRLIEAFKKVKTGVLKGKPLQLVISGKKGWLYREIFAKVKQFGLESDVVFSGYTDPRDLPDLYRHALCLVNPSLYEGFGIPVVEAMACGCPVIVSRTSSLPEVAGQAGIYIDPGNVSDIAEKILSVIKMSNKERRKIIQKGLNQVEKFNWENCAQETLAVLKEAVI